MDYSVNERIRAKEVRLIDDEGTQLGIVSTREALNKARDAGLDLVEVSNKATPPVCKILDYGKFKYDQEKRAKEAAKKQRANRIELKELQFRPTTDEHDIQTKMKKASEFLGDGNKVKFVMKFKGREMAHKDQGMSVINQIIERLEATIEQAPKDQGRSIIAVIAPPKG